MPLLQDVNANDQVEDGDQGGLDREDWSSNR